MLCSRSQGFTKCRIGIIHSTALLFCLGTVHKYACQTILVDIRTWKWAMKKWPFRNGKVSAMDALLRIPLQNDFLPLVDSISCSAVVRIVVAHWFSSLQFETRYRFD